LPPCCMDRRYGRTEPDPCSGLCDADVLRASQLQHSVQYVDRDGHLARLSPVRLEAQPVTDDALPSILLHRSPAWAASGRVGWGRGESPPPCRGTLLAIQSECRSAPSHPQAEAPGDQLGRVRRRSARSRQPDRVVHAGGGRGLDGSAAHHPRRAGLLLRSGDRHDADPAGGVPLGAAPDRRADRLHPPAARSRSPGAGPLDPEPPCRDTEATGASVWPRLRAGAPAGGQHRSTPLRPGEWLVEKHGTKRRRAWRVLHPATDADTGRIVASVLTGKDADDGSQVGPLLDQVDGPVASFTGDGAYDRDDVYAEVAARHPEAAVVVPPRANAVPSDAAQTAPTRRDEHVRCIAERGRMGWQRASGYGWRALVESDISRWKRVVGDGLRFQTDGRQATEVAIAADVLNRMLELGRPEYVRTA